MRRTDRAGGTDRVPTESVSLAWIVIAFLREELQAVRSHPRDASASESESDY